MKYRMYAKFNLARLVSLSPCAALIISKNNYEFGD